MSEYALKREIENRLVRNLAQRTKGRVGYFYALEWSCAGHLHAHILLSGTQRLALTELQHFWRSGHSASIALQGTEARLRRIESSIRYVTKYLSAEPCYWEISRRVPRLHAAR